MTTKCFKVSARFPVYLKRESPKFIIGSCKKMKTLYYRSVINWNKKDWEKTDGLANKKGCYIYLWHDVPIYVGKTVAEKGFQSECFHSHKTGNSKKDGKGILTEFLFHKKVFKCKIKKDAETDSPMSLLFIYWDGKNSVDLERVVDKMESYLIIKAFEKNSDLLNSRKKIKKWSIPGFENEKGGDKNSKVLNKLLSKTN